MQDRLASRTADAWVAFAGNVNWREPTLRDWHRLDDFAVAVRAQDDRVDIRDLLWEAECPVGAMASIVSRFDTYMAVLDTHATQSRRRSRRGAHSWGSALAAALLIGALCVHERGCEDALHVGI